jgi:hypothetical protein
MYGRLRVIAVMLLASIPSVALAHPRDSVPANAPRVSDVASKPGPRLDNASSAFRAASHAADTSAAAPRAGNNVSKPVAIMLVGAAAIVLGSAVVEGDLGELVVIGGVVAMLYGLYQYLK